MKKALFLLLPALVLLSGLSGLADAAATGPQTFQITSATQVTLDGGTCGADALKAGMHATVVADPLQPGAASTIDAHTAGAVGGKPQQAKLAGKGGKEDALHWTIISVNATAISVSEK